MSYSGPGIVYRADKLPDGGKPGDILILDPNGNPAWLTPGGGGASTGGLHPVLLAGNSAGNLGIQELSRISGVYGGGGNVAYIDLLTSTPLLGGRLNLVGGSTPSGAAGAQITFNAAIETTGQGGTLDLSGGVDDEGNHPAFLTLGGGQGIAGGSGDFQIEAGNAAVGAFGGGNGAIRAGASQNGHLGAEIFLFGGEFGVGSSGGNLSLKGGDAGDGTTGGFLIATGGTNGTTAGQVTLSAGNRPASGTVGGKLALSSPHAFAGGGVELRAGDTAPSGGVGGAFLQLIGGDVNGPGGEAGLYAGWAKSGLTGPGGKLTFEAGRGFVGANVVFGSKIELLGGQSSGLGGGLNIFTGDAASGTNANGGSITISLGEGDGSGKSGLLILHDMPQIDPAVPSAVWVDRGVFVQSGKTAPDIYLHRLTEVPTNKTYVLILHSGRAGTITGLHHKMASGTLTANVQINGVSVNGLSAVPVTSTKTLTNGSGPSTVFAIGATIQIIVTAVSSPVDFQISLVMI